MDHYKIEGETLKSYFDKYAVKKEQAYHKNYNQNKNKQYNLF